MTAGSPPKIGSIDTQLTPVRIDGPNKPRGINMMGHAWDSSPLP